MASRLRVGAPGRARATTPALPADLSPPDSRGHPEISAAAPPLLPFLLLLPLLLVSLLLLLRSRRGRTRRLPKGFPPGPWPLPLVGNLLSLGEQPHETLTEMANEHGPVFSVWLATIPAVIVCGYAAVRECLQLRATDFADRPCLPLFQRLTGMRGLLNARFGPGWAEQRRLAVYSVHAFGTARPDFESLLQEECAHLLEAMDKAFEAADAKLASSSSESSSAAAAAAAAAAEISASCDSPPTDVSTSSPAASRSSTAKSSPRIVPSAAAAAAACASPSSHFRASSDSSAPPSPSQTPSSPSSSSTQPATSPPRRHQNAAATGGGGSGGGIDLGPLITNAVSNITNVVIFGERFAYGDTEFEGMVQMFSENVALAASPWAFLYSAFPRAVGAMPIGSHRRLFANAERVRVCLVSLTEKFSRGRVPGKPRHMVDAYLDQVEAAEEEAAAAAAAAAAAEAARAEEETEASSRTVSSGSPETNSPSARFPSPSPPLLSSPPTSSASSPTSPPSSSPTSSPSSSPTSSPSPPPPPPPPPPASSFTRDNMIFTIGELFIAGTETSSNTLRWAILYMCVYPELQDELHAELSRALSGEEPRALRLSDRARTPLLEASLHEVMRHATIAPLGIFRAAARDASLAGYAVPRGTLVVANLHSAHRDPRAWERAHEFRPRRFLDADGRFVRRKEFVAFSIGRRHCVGEKLALMELFLFLGSMLLRFRFSLAGAGAPDLRPRLGFTLQPRPYRVCATRR